MKRAVMFLLLICMVVPVRCDSGDEKTVVTGDQIEIVKGGEIVIFTGNAEVKRGRSLLKADRIKQDKKTNLAEAEGNIYLRTFSKKEELIEATGSFARYIPEAGKGEFWGDRTTVVYHVQASTQPLNLIADKIDFDQTAEILHAHGNVEIISSSASAYAQDAIFKQHDKVVFLTGTPQPKIVYDKKNTYTADLITLYVDTKAAILQGHVHGKMYDTKKH